MFTGIVTAMGSVRAVEKRGDTHIVIDAPFDTSIVDVGASMACAGCCLTVVDRGNAKGHWFAVNASGETLSKTTIRSWKVGDKVNLERPLRLGDRLGGHLVQGHVDVTAPVLKTEQSGDDWIVEIELPERHAASIIEKGSITVDGISLTVAALGPGWFCVHIIPETLERTNIADYASGTLVNLEFDMVGKYILRGEELAG